MPPKMTYIVMTNKVCIALYKHAKINPILMYCHLVTWIFDNYNLIISQTIISKAIVHFATLLVTTYKENL